MVAPNLFHSPPHNPILSRDQKRQGSSLDREGKAVGYCGAAVASRASPTGEEAVPFYSVDEKTATLVMWSGSGV
jgi:hypothetical protein